MTQETSNGLTLLSFEQPLPNDKTHAWDRERHISVIRSYVVEGEPLEEAALTDMYENPEALSFQLQDLEGWVDAARRGEPGVWLSKGATWRLAFMKTVMDWAVEAGNGSTNFLADHTAGNGTSGLPLCTSTPIGATSERRALI